MLDSEEKAKDWLQNIESSHCLNYWMKHGRMDMVLGMRMDMNMQMDKELFDKILNVIEQKDIDYQGFFEVMEVQNIDFPDKIDILSPKKTEVIKTSRRKLVFYFLHNSQVSDKTSIIFYNQYLDIETHKLGMQLWAEEPKG